MLTGNATTCLCICTNPCIDHLASYSPPRRFSIAATLHSGASLSHTLREIMAAGLSGSLAELLSYKALELAMIGPADRLPQATTNISESLGRDFTPGEAAHVLRGSGAPALANRPRAAVQQRNALMHADQSLEADVPHFLPHSARVKDSAVRGAHASQAAGKGDDGLNLWAKAAAARKRLKAMVTAPSFEHHMDDSSAAQLDVHGGIQRQVDERAAAQHTHTHMAARP